MVDYKGSSKSIKFLELLIPIVFSIFGIGLFESGDSFFILADLLAESIFSVDLFNLFWLEVIFLFKLSYLGQFFVAIPYFFLKGFKERFILLVYDLCFLFLRLLVLWL